MLVEKAKQYLDLIDAKKFKVFYSSEFEDQKKIKEILSDMPRFEEFNEKRENIRKINLKDALEMTLLYQEPLLDKDQEFHEFRKYNYYKYKN